MANLTPRNRRLARLAAVVAGGLAVSACMTATPYRPATGSGTMRTGYSDQQIENNRFRVSFAGNSITSRETVERYLLFRAAELTVQNGDDYFVLADRDTEKKTRTYATPGIGGGFYGGPWGGWGPSWRYYRPRFGWRSWDPFWGDPFFDRDIDIRTVEQYEAIAEIVTGRGPKPADNVRAFDAREVMSRLGPSIQTPQPGR
jgi:hypothetical protein